MAAQNNTTPAWAAAPIKSVLPSTNNGTPGLVTVQAGQEVEIAPPNKNVVGSAPWLRLRVRFDLAQANAARDMLGGRVTYDAANETTQAYPNIARPVGVPGADTNTVYELVLDRIRVAYNADGTPDANWKVFIGQNTDGGADITNAEIVWEYPDLNFG